MARYPRSSDVSYSFGPGPPSPAVKALIIANVGIFLVLFFLPDGASQPLLLQFGLRPAAVLGQLQLWQVVTYMFLHSPAGISHILFNMLVLWMFGTDLEHLWRTRFFTKYYFVTGIGAALLTVAWSLSPLRASGDLYQSVVIGASGAIYGILLAYGLSFPNRLVYLFVFPVPARYYVIIVGAIAFLMSTGQAGSGVAHTAHLGGLVVGYLYLKGLRFRPIDELKYRYLRWKMNRARSKFGVHSGGRDDDWKSDWKKHIH